MAQVCSQAPMTSPAMQTDDIQMNWLANYILCCATRHNQMYGPPAEKQAVLSDHKHHSINIKHYCKAHHKTPPRGTKTGFLLDRLTGYQLT